MKQNRKKRLTAMMIIILAVAMLLSACSPDVAEEEPVAKPEEAAKVVKIGFLSPITGIRPEEGAAARNAFQLAIDQANESGKFPYTIEVFFADDQSAEHVAVAAARKIVDDPLIVAASGFMDSGPAASAIPVFKEAGIPLLIWGANSETLISEENVPYITHFAPTIKQENIPLARITMGELGYTDWFIFSDKSEYGSDNFNAFMAELQERNITPLALSQVKEDITDLSPVVQMIKSSGAKAVYCGSSAPLAAQLKIQLHQAGVTDILFCGTSGMKTEEFRSIGDPAAEGSLVISPGVVLESTVAGRKFIEDYSEQGYLEPIGVYTPYAYDAALILLNALSACGEAPTPELMAQAILNGETNGVAGITAFNEIGQSTNIAVYPNVIQDGVWVPYQDSRYASGHRSFGGR